MGYSQASTIVLPKLHRIVSGHIDKTLGFIPDEAHTAVLEQYNTIYEKHCEREANLFITNIGKYHSVVVGIPYHFTPAFLRVFTSLLHSDKTGRKLEKKISLNGNIRGFWCIAFDDDAIKAQAEMESSRCTRIIDGGGIEKAIDYAISRGVIRVDGEYKAQIKRLSCERWWLRQLLKIRTQGQEAQAQLLGLVKKHISKNGYNNQQSKHESSIQMLAGNVAISPDGKEVSLLDIAMTAIKGRFSRLLCWTDGMGDYADKKSHECAMYTITCPSRMHPNSKKYDGTTTRESQQYLADLWNQANARFKKRGIYPYGVRVSEPHKDGAVHWHVMLFASLEVLEEIDGILTDHALRIDGEEKGADLHRYEFKMIEKREGGAKPSSYLFKYLMKGLGGDANNWTAGDVDKIITEKLTSVKAWARTHGIRQVQIVGGASVGVWNELRRIDKELDDTYLEAIRLACIDNNFCRYFELQGGHKVGKTKHYARPCRESVKVISEHLDIETGEIIEDVEEAINAYGEIIEEVVGVKTASQEIINRRPKWSINWTSPSKTGSTQSLETIESFSIVQEDLFKIDYSDIPSSAELEAYDVAMGWV